MPPLGGGGTGNAIVGKTVVGPISGFGSVIVNGTRYNTDQANFMIDGVPGTQADLKVGQIVVLKSDNNNNAQSVSYEEIVEGPVAGLDVNAGTFMVLEQLVIVDNLTSFDDDINPENIEGLTNGMIVEISGEHDANGDIRATRIDKSDDDDNDYEVHGVVENHDPVAMTFYIGDLRVGYANAELDDFGADGIQNGDLVEVEGSTFLNDGTLVATEVENENDDDDDRDGDDDDEGEISGLITSVDSATRFTIGTTTVIITDNTEFEDGSAADLVLNANVEVEGQFNENGELVAEEIEFEDRSDTEVEGRIDAIDTVNRTITVGGITFAVTDTTRFEDDDDDNDQTFSFENLAVGDHVEIDGYEDASGTLIATKVEREADDDDDNDNDNDNDESDTEIEGAVSEIGSDHLVVAGRTIFVDANTAYELNDREVSAAEFFAAVQIGDIVEVEGYEDEDGNFIAEDIELEDDD